MMASNSSDGEPESQRYQCLIRSVDKALTESRSAIDIRAAVRDCYGDDATIFADDATGKSGEEVLSELVEGVIDRTNDRLRSDVRDVLVKEDVNSKLLRLDRLVAKFDAQDEESKAAEESDKKSAQDAAERARLPPGIGPADVLSYHAHRIKVQERDQLLAEIASVEAESEAIREEIERGRAQIKETMTSVEERGKEMEKTADACSFSGVS